MTAGHTMSNPVSNAQPKRATLIQPWPAYFHRSLSAVRHVTSYCPTFPDTPLSSSCDDLGMPHVTHTTYPSVLVIIVYVNVCVDLIFDNHNSEVYLTHAHGAQQTAA